MGFPIVEISHISHYTTTTTSMKIYVLLENLQKKLSFVNHAVSQKSQLIILQNIHIEAKGSELIISSTDLEIGIKVVIPANIEEEGKVVIPAKRFTDLISTLKSGKIILQTEGQQLEVIGEKTKSVFQVMSSSEEFPSLYEEVGEKIAEVMTEDLEAAVSPVVLSASFDTARPALSGVLVQKEAEGFLLVATDGYRLSLKHTRSSLTNEGEQLEKPMIVPARIFKEALLMKDEGEIEIYISTKGNQILFSQGKTILVGRLIDAQFPNYRKIIPNSFETSVVFDREEMAQAVKISSVFARESANVIKFSIKEEKIIVSTNAPSVGENTVEVEAKIQGEESEIAFNAKYITDFLANVRGEEIMLQVSGPLSPGVFKIKDDESFLHIIMPIRVQS